MRTDDYYIGCQSVPILGSSKQRVISNCSLPIACLLATKMRVKVMHHANVNLFPCPEQEPDTYMAHEALLQELKDKITMTVYKVHALKKQNPGNVMAWEGRVNAYHQKLQELQMHISDQGPYLFGEAIWFANFMLLISLV